MILTHDAMDNLKEKKFFERIKGHFWLTIETRPFMRVVQGYAQTLMDM
jgi:hypothetical protein